jgi:hypothetical protein
VITLYTAEGKKIQVNSSYRYEGDGSEAQGPDDQEEMTQHHHVECVFQTPNEART